MPLLKEVAASQATQQREPPKTLTPPSTKLSKAEEQRAARAWAEAQSIGCDLSCADPVDDEC